MYSNRPIASTSGGNRPLRHQRPGQRLGRKSGLVGRPFLLRATQNSHRIPAESLDASHTSNITNQHLDFFDHGAPVNQIEGEHDFETPAVAQTLDGLRIEVQGFRAEIQAFGAMMEELNSKIDGVQAKVVEIMDAFQDLAASDAQDENETGVPGSAPMGNMMSFSNH